MEIADHIPDESYNREIPVSTQNVNGLAGDSRHKLVQRLDFVMRTETRTATLTEPLELAVVVPTLNESSNIVPLLEGIQNALEGVNWEVIFVDDDSTDGTAEFIRQISRAKSNVRVLHRIGRRGLSSACIEGMLATAAPFIVVMDADLQHDERLLPKMLAIAREQALDVVVGSRNVDGGSMGTFAAHRRWLSHAGRQLSQYVCRCSIQDPMSGFFLVRRAFLDAAVRRLSGVGFKILVDLLASAPRPVRLAELPYEFRCRVNGESKLDTTTLVEYLVLVGDKLSGGYLPIRFLFFGAVGSIGIAVHAAVVSILFASGHLQFFTSQASATLASMTSNFFLNNWLTYRDIRLKGKHILSGLLAFYLACSIGALSSVSIANWLYQKHIPWYASACFGIGISAVWNYAATSVFVWRRMRRRRQA